MVESIVPYYGIFLLANPRVSWVVLDGFRNHPQIPDRLREAATIRVKHVLATANLALAHRVGDHFVLVRKSKPSGLASLRTF